MDGFDPKLRISISTIPNDAQAEIDELAGTAADPGIVPK
jgi:hypothetical protein